MPVKFNPKSKELLLSEDRRKGLDIHRLLSLMPILHHHQVADIGCGPGFFTIPLAKYLFDGKVYALDIQQEMLDATREEVEGVNLTNVELMLSAEKQLPLEDDSLDGALMAFVLQEANSRTALLKEVWRCLRQSGWFTILEWHKTKTNSGPPQKQRIEQDKMLAMAEKQGFRIRARRDINPDQYMLMLRK